MAYGELKVDSITFTDGGTDATVSVSGLVKNPTFSGDIIVNGNISGTTITGDSAGFGSVTGVTVTGTTANFVSGVFTTRVSGTAITGNTAGFTTVTGTTVTGTTANFITVSGTTVTGNAAQFTSVTGSTAGFTTVTGTTVTGTTANFVTVSGTAITGNTAGFTTVTGTTVTGTTANFNTVSGTTVTGGTGNFTSVSATTATITSGVFAAGTAAAPSVSVGTTDNGLYSPGADQVAISTNGTGQVFVGSNGNLGVGTLNATNAAGKIHSRADGNEAKPLLVLQNRDTGGSAGGAINFVNGAVDLSDNRYSYIRGIVTGAGENGNHIIFGTNASGQDPTEKLRITSNGKLGLGTSSPDAKLKIQTVGSDIPQSAFGIRQNNAADTTQTTLSVEIDPVNSTSRILSSATSNPRLALYTSNQLALYIDESQQVGIGTTSPSRPLHIAASDCRIRLTDTDADTVSVELQNSSGNGILSTNGATSLLFTTNNNEAARIDSSGRLLVGTSSSISGSVGATNIQVAATSSDQGGLSLFRSFPTGTPAGTAYLQLGRNGGSSVGDFTIVASSSRLGLISFDGADGSAYKAGAHIYAEVDGTPGANDMPGRLVFSTTADGASSPTERMRISSNGSSHFGPSAAAGGVGETLRLQTLDSTNKALVCRTSNASSTSYSMVQFLDGDSNSCGEIIINASANTTNYSTSSDYRLKENIASISSPVERLNKLNPCSFNFISSPSTRFDGFLAHEAQAVVPEAVNGIKDEVDDEGNPVYQGIDQSKLVPLLTAALQEALAEIESLKARVTALEP